LTDDVYDFEDQETEAQGRGHLFLWTVFNLLLVGVAFACWLGSFYIFGHPEEPRPYQILQKLHKLDPPKRFEITAAPRGEFLTPQRLFERYSKLPPLKLQDENANLLRDYIKNYRETKRLVPYVTGHYEIIKSYELQKSDLFTSGMIALAAADDNSRIIIEHVYPTTKENVPRLQPLLQTGIELKLERTRDIPALIHVAATADGHYQFTVVPISYGEYALKNGVGTFSLEPPTALNLAGGVPIIRGKMLIEAMDEYAEYRRSKPPPTDDTAKAHEPELVRLDAFEPGTKLPETGAMPELPTATPIPAATARIATARGGATPPKLAMNATPKPRGATPIPIATPIPRSAVAAAATPGASPSGVPLKPFLTAIPEGVRRSAGNWRMYPPGQQPAGRAITATEAETYADRSDLGERLYLRGSFVVTASQDNWAVLRSQGGASKPGAPNVRIIVEYPDSALPPAQGATFSRDDTRGFQIQDISRRADGINISVREVIQAQ
jgi:hypothetical protein